MKVGKLKLNHCNELKTLPENFGNLNIPDIRDMYGPDFLTLQLDNGALEGGDNGTWRVDAEQIWEDIALDEIRRGGLTPDA